jgi:hypothetical protein
VEERETLVELARVSLEDKYILQSGRIYLTGIQALVRLPHDHFGKPVSTFPDHALAAANLSQLTS